MDGVIGVDDGRSHSAAPAVRRWIAGSAVVVIAAAVAFVIVGVVAGAPVADAPWQPVTGVSSTAGPEAARRLDRLRPRGQVVVIDTARGRFRVMRDGAVLHEAACSAGSGTVLKEPGGRVWVFDSPLGERRVVSKRRDPIWIKPDWAFVEEGTQPPDDPAARRDDVSLGDYALSLGDGYLIHGTLFQSLLGQPVTHGCIRLADGDLEYVWRTVAVGDRVYLY
jgi:L,D-transpeptidase YbiS